MQREETKKKNLFSKLCQSSNNKKKQIINGISACFNPGQLIAIMGPSGRLSASHRLMCGVVCVRAHVHACVRVCAC